MTSEPTGAAPSGDAELRERVLMEFYNLDIIDYEPDGRTFEDARDAVMEAVDSYVEEQREQAVAELRGSIIDFLGNEGGPAWLWELVADD
jgi:hypothetical protein